MVDGRVLRQGLAAMGASRFWQLRDILADISWTGGECRRKRLKRAPTQISPDWIAGGECGMLCVQVAGSGPVWLSLA